MQRRDFLKHGTGAIALALAAPGLRGQQPNETERRTTMRIKLTSVPVADQDKALAFYTGVLGFVKKREIPVGAARFLTVVSPEEPDGTELLLEPNGDHAPTKAYKEALVKAGIP
jgi:hypothetical protein